MYAGTFVICLAVLAYEILSVRTIAFVLGSGYVYFVVALAMLGLSAAGSLLSISRLNESAAARSRTLFRLCIALAVCIVATYYGSSFVKDVVNTRVASAGVAGGMSGIVQETVGSGIYAALVLGALLSIPHFLFGAILMILFRTVRDDQYHKLYFSDLFGGAAGCVIAFWLMETWSYASTLLIPPALCLAAGGVYVCASSRTRAAVAFLLSSLLLLWPHAGLPVGPLEPKAQLNDLARDYDVKKQVRELWHGWNSFSRVGALEVVAPDRGRRSHVMALGNGEGHARLIRYDTGGYGDWTFTPAKLAVVLGSPKDVLVIFAGTGADMLAIDAYTGGQARITGVELNRTMIEGATGLSDFALSAFYLRPNISMRVEEARAFLERDRRRYDVILLSFSGATTSYYAGSMGHTTQFVYTREAMESLLDHLTPDGYLVYMNTNKVNTLATLRDILDKRGRTAAAPNAAIVLYRPGSEVSRWDRWWDENPAILKPSGFSPVEVERIAASAKDLNMAVAYAPYAEPNPHFWPYATVLRDGDLRDALEQLNNRTNLRFSVVTDDRPFSFDLFRTNRYFHKEFWKKARSRDLERAYERYRVQHLVFVAGIIVAAVGLILGPLAFTRGPGWNSLTLNHLLFFSALGAGFMLIEIGLMHKMSLLLGNPGLSIAIVLSSLIVFAGVGSLVSDRWFARGWTFRKTVLLIVAVTGAYLVGADTLLHYAMTWPSWAKPLFVIGLVVPFGLGMGQLMPQGLVRARQDNSALVPWAWAINGALGTIAAGLAPLLAQISGFKFVVALGAACYCVILVLPRYRGK